MIQDLETRKTLQMTVFTVYEKPVNAAIARIWRTVKANVENTANCSI